MSSLEFETYLVGGAVRDELLQRPVTDRDWVVIGATPDDLLSQGPKNLVKNRVNHAVGHSGMKFVGSWAFSFLKK